MAILDRVLVAVQLVLGVAATVGLITGSIWMLVESWREQDDRHRRREARSCTRGRP